MAELVSIDEAAERLNLSQKSLRRRIERGTLESVRRDGRRLIPLGEVERLAAETNSVAGQGVSPSAVLPRGFEDLSTYLARLEELAAENGRLRALAEVSESTRAAMTDELLELRATKRTLELQLSAAEAAAAASPRRWWQRKPEAVALSQGQG